MFGRKLLGAALVAAMALVPTMADAFDWAYDVKVTVIEVTYLPDRVGFMVDRSVGSCAAGSWLMWPGQGSDPAARAANTQAILSTLITAKGSGQSIRIFGRNAGCTIDYLYLI